MERCSKNYVWFGQYRSKEIQINRNERLYVELETKGNGTFVMNRRKRIGNDLGMEKRYGTWKMNDANTLELKTERIVWMTSSWGGNERGERTYDEEEIKKYSVRAKRTRSGDIRFNEGSTTILLCREGTNGPSDVESKL